MRRPGTSPAAATRSQTPAGRPVVVMAHGLAGTKDSGLAAVRRARSPPPGSTSLAFDYRGFGASGGSPRQTVDVAGQLADYRAAHGGRAPAARGRPAAARALGRLAVRRPRARGRGRRATTSPPWSSLTPARRRRSRPAGTRWPATPTRSCAFDRRRRPARGRRRRRPVRAVMMPVVGRRGELAALTPRRLLRGLPRARRSDLAQRGRRRASGSSSAISGPAGMPIGIDCPVLVQIADFDRSAPPQAAGQGSRSRRAPRCGTTPATTSTCGRASRGSSAAVAHQVRVPDPMLAPTVADLRAVAYAVPRSSRTQSSSPVAGRGALRRPARA